MNTTRSTCPSRHPLPRRSRPGVGWLACGSALAIAALAVAAGCAWLQSDAQVSPVDQQFMLTAASVGTAEVDLGELAARRATDPAVRVLGQHLVDEHTRINAQLGEVAQAKRVKLLKAMDPANRTLYDELSRVSGPVFDREYLLAQINIHRMGNALYQSEADAGEDADVRSFAQRNLPAGAAHLRAAQALLSHTGSNG